MQRRLVEQDCFGLGSHVEARYWPSRHAVDMSCFDTAANQGTNRDHEESILVWREDVLILAYMYCTVLQHEHALTKIRPGWPTSPRP